MKLDRNVEGGHGNKYGLIKNRRIEELRKPDSGLPGDLVDALLTLANYEVLDWGATPETEFFVMRLKDLFAAGGLAGYAAAAANYDDEYAREVWDLSQRSGRHHPNCKKPD